jgi:hypothetical protein
LRKRSLIFFSFFLVLEETRGLEKELTKKFKNDKIYIMKNEFKILLILLSTIFLVLFFSFYLKNSTFAATCGNGVCESGENCENCSLDCSPACGNGVCESSCGENSSNCSIDCGPTCGNGICELGESCSNCSIDCGPCGPTCGNGVCESGESPSNCCIDCYERHYQKRCYNNDVYWYDCNGQRNDKAQECGDSGWADEYRCSGNWVQRKWIEKGCSNAQCYSTEKWKDYQYCSNYCLNGKCILPPAVITKGVVVTY